MVILIKKTHKTKTKKPKPKHKRIPQQEENRKIPIPEQFLVLVVSCLSVVIAWVFVIEAVTESVHHLPGQV